MKDPHTITRQDHCLDVLRRYDRDRYLATLLLPDTYRDDIVALYAFNAEVSRISDLVSEPMPGEIRLQWWRDVIASPEGGEGRANPLAAALLDVIQKHDLPRDAFDKMLLARAFDLYNDPMPTLDALEAYCGETTSLLFHMVALSAGIEQSSRLADCSGHAGVAYGLMCLLKDIPKHASRERLYIPQDILEKAGAEAVRILNGDMHEGLKKALLMMIDHCRHHKTMALEALDDLPVEAKGVFRPLTLIDPVLKKLEKTGFNPFQDPVRLSQFHVQWRLWRGL